MFTTDTIGVWNELETTDFIDDTVCLNPAIGEVEKIYNTVVALSRRKVVVIEQEDYSYR